MSEKIHTEDLPNSWELVPLGEFVENEKGKKPKQESKEKTTEFNLPYIDIQAFEEGIIKSWTNGEGCRLCYEDDFLMVWDGSRSGLVGKGVNGALGSTLVRINFPGIFNDYAYYFLQSKFAEINSRAKGVGIPHVDPNLLWNYGFPIPPLNEQKRIVAKIEELFSELDSGIESLKTAREQLKVYRQAVLKHAFEGKLTHEWRIKNEAAIEPVSKLLCRVNDNRTSYYNSRMEEYKATLKDWQVQQKKGKPPNKPRKDPEITPHIDEFKDLPVLPKEWMWVLLAQLSHHIVDGTHKTPRYVQEGVPFISAKDINNFRISFEDTRYITQDEHEELVKRCHPKKGCVLITESGTIGRVAVVQTDDAFSLFESVANVPVIEPIYPDYIAYISYLSATGAFGANKQKGVAVRHLHLEDLRRIPIPLPPIEEQKQIIMLLNEAISVIENLENEIDDQLQKSEALRQSILKKAFSGQLVAQNPADEPASLLLERIRNEKATAKPIAKKLKEKRKAA